MKGDAKVVDLLNRLLAGELTAIDQYFCHSRMYQNWGLNKLYERIEHERTDEVGHAEVLIKRILFLEGMPNLGVRAPLRIGQDVPGMLKNDLDLELSVIAALKGAISACETARDYETRNLLQKMLADTEEDHARWLEQQLWLINKTGLQNYLQSQM